MKHIINLFVVLALLLLPLSNVQAQGVPHVVYSTIPVSAEITAAVDALLATNPPVNVPDYILTYAKPRGAFTWVVSLAAAQEWTPDWTAESAQWVGTLRLEATPSGTYEAHYVNAAQPKVASPSRPAGGSTSIRLPFAPNRSAQYGRQGAYTAGYGFDGLAVDFIGGNDLGSNVMSDVVYASDAGEIDYVCDDGTSIAVRVVGATETFIYAYLVDNANLEIGHEFTKGSTIGTLVHGSFDDTCGTVDQSDNHYKLRWAFQPSNNVFLTSTWTLNVTTDEWTSPQGVVKPGQYLLSPTVDPGEDVTTDSTGFWDFLLAGVVSVIGVTLLAIMPEHEDVTFLQTVFSGIAAVFAIAYVMTKGSITLYPVFIVIGLIIIMELLRIAITIVVLIFRILKLIPFA